MKENYFKITREYMYANLIYATHKRNYIIY